MGNRRSEFPLPGHFVRNACPAEDDLILEARALLAQRYGYQPRFQRALAALLRGTEPASVVLAAFDDRCASGSDTKIFQSPLLAGAAA